jgi:hypothetical protein
MMAATGFKGFLFVDGKLYGRNNFEYEVGRTRVDVDRGLYFGTDLETVFWYYPPRSSHRYGRIEYKRERVRFVDKTEGMGDKTVGITEELTVLELLTGTYQVCVKGKTKFVYFLNGEVVRKPPNPHKTGGKKAKSLTELREIRLKRFAPCS